MELNTQAIYAFWNAEPIEAHEATNKLFYRVIGGYKFQFRKIDYRKQTQLSLRVAALAKNLEPLFKASTVLKDAELLKDPLQVAAAEEFNRQHMMTVLPDLLGFIGDPSVETLLNDLIQLASVDRGNGEFEPLTNPLVAESVFGEDISLQLPVATTVLEVNLAGFIKRVVSAFASKT